MSHATMAMMTGIPHERVPPFKGLVRPTFPPPPTPTTETKID